jgi:hypothetical protein
MNSQFHGNSLLSTQYQDMQDESKMDMLPRARENRVSLKLFKPRSFETSKRTSVTTLDPEDPRASDTSSQALTFHDGHLSSLISLLAAAMADPSKAESEQIFQVLRLQKGNKVGLFQPTRYSC